MYLVVRGGLRAVGGTHNYICIYSYTYVDVCMYVCVYIYIFNM
jgi:hypothetical protein